MSLRRLCIVALCGVLAAATAAAAPTPPRLTATIPTGPAPCGAVTAYGSVWIAVDGAGVVLRVDARRSRISRRVPVGKTACAAAAGAGAVWTTLYGAAELVRIDHRTGHVRRAHVGSNPFDVAVAGRHVWVTSFDDGTITSLNPSSLEVEQTLAVGGHPAGLAVCRGRLWIGAARSDSWLTALDPSTGRMDRIELGIMTPTWPECVGGDVWVTTPDSVLRVDPGSGRLRARIRLGGTPVITAAAPDGTIWVTDKEQNRVVRIDPGTNTVVDEFAAGPGAFALARVGGSMWVTSYAGSDIRRYTPG